jgi:hypothetical protein
MGSVPNLGLPTVPWEPLSPKGMQTGGRQCLDSHDLTRSGQADKLPSTLWTGENIH